jgi:hypothetical protein
MPVYCDNCQTERKDNSRICQKCGKKFGGSLWVLMFGIVMGIVAPLLLYIGVQTGSIKGGGDDPIKILIMWELPIWTVTATLFDHNRVRSQVYFWVGGIMTILAVVWANK